MSPESTQAPAAPWWRHGHVWLVIAGPVAVVLAGVATVWIAVRTPDPVVAVDYYRRGIEINKTLAELGRGAGTGPAGAQPRRHPGRCAARPASLTGQPNTEETRMWTQRPMWIAWPAFLAAGLLEMLVFAMVDPHDLHWFGQPLDWSRQGIYTLSFFVFWAITAASSALTTLLAMSPFELNRCPLPANDRPDGCPKQGACN